MCGFVGIISKKRKQFPDSKLREMASLISHRGPDDEGYFYDKAWLALAFRRLSILDLSKKGHQPMLSLDKRYAIVFNGEIYNYLELREELQEYGYIFMSDSDTEVVLAAYQLWGKQCTSRFTGMYAFIVADLKEEKLFAARDPLGIKPLFMFEDSEHFIFCSEVKSLLPYKELEPEPECIREYLVFRSVIGRKTMFKDVYSLSPGHSLTYSDGKMTEHEFFSIASTLKPKSGRSFLRTCEEVEDTLKESVKIHLRSDVELGIQLSGGVDSSLITAMAAKESGKKFHTFSISFAESMFDESEYQKRISGHYGTTHHDYRMTEDHFTGLFRKAIWHYEHPLNDPNSVATYYLTENAKKHITVMLSGEGADESFMGYSRFNRDSVKKLKFRTWLYRHPELREKLYNLWPLSKGRALFNITRYRPSMYTLTYSDLNLVDSLLKGNDSEMSFRHGVSESAAGDVLNEAILQDQVCDLAQWFWRADRMGMASSMELRVPFCTPDLFRLANSIPYSQRVYKGERKAVLKKIAEKYMDYDQIYRKKMGFGMPVDTWLRRQGAFRKLFDETISSEDFRHRSFLDYDFFKELFRRHREGIYEERSSGFLWTYLNIEIWYKMFFEGGWKNL